VRRLFLDRERLQTIEGLPDNVMLWDLQKGIPFPDNSIDAVYHSHLIEHLDQAAARSLSREVLRVLKPGGIHRIAVPDFERACRRYIAHVAACEAEPQLVPAHDRAIAEVIEQMTRSEAHGTSQRPPTRRFVENLLLGDAARRGETHRWMYDRFSLAHLLRDVGFREAEQAPWNTSKIPNWSDFGLEVGKDGGEYLDDSVYVEAVK
jgi:SAM-dependent methyltransferase